MNIKKRIPKFLSLLLCFSMTFGNMIPAYAMENTSDNSTTVIDGENISTKERNLEDITVTYKQASSFFVTIPKTIVLDGWKQSTYAVKVSGDIDADQCVYVAPVDGIAKTENIDFYMKDQATENAKDDVVANVTHNKFHWDSTEVAGSYKQDDNVVSAPDLTAGAWKGIFQMEIKLETHVTHKHNYVETITKEPTCTETGEKKYTCDCGNSYIEVIPAKGHHFENGECTDCHEKDPNHEHSYTETITKEPTCTEAGKKTYTCTCGHSYTEEILATGHHFEKGECTDCGEKEADPYETAPVAAYSNWNYTLDDENNIITLKHYIGSETDVIVYANYEVNGKTYKTQIATNYEHSNIANYMFNGSSDNKSIRNIKSIKFSKNIDTSNVTDMNYMFNACYALTDLDISCFDTSNVTNMYNMFAFCESLTNLDVSNFDTSKVTTMSSMFEYCKSLTILDLSNFDTSNVINMRHMFANCSSLVTLDLSNCDTHNVKDMIYMFNNCAALKTIYVSRGKWSTLLAASSDVKYNTITGYVKGTTLMFSGCGISKVTYYGEDPNSYELAPDEDYLNWNYTLDDVDNIITLNYYIGSETEVIVYTNYVIGDKIYKTQIKSNDGNSNNTPYMFNAYATGINHDNITKFIKFSHNIDTSNVTSMAYMFMNCQMLTDLDISCFDTSNVTNMSSMFYGCCKLTELDLTNFDTSKVTDMSGMFTDCKKLTLLNISTFNTSNVTKMNDMFSASKKSTTVLASLDLSSFDTTNVTQMERMFQNNSSLRTIYVTEGKWLTSQANTAFMFNSCGTSSVTYK